MAVDEDTLTATGYVLAVVVQAEQCQPPEQVRTGWPSSWRKIWQFQSHGSCGEQLGQLVQQGMLRTRSELS
jgi:hypothetical protein